MPKACLLLFVFLFLGLRSLAGPEIGAWGRQVGNFSVKYKMQTRIADDKFAVLFYLSEKLVRHKLHESEMFNIYFDQDFDFPDSSFFALGYGSTRDNWEPERKGIKLIFRDRDFDIHKVLNIINAACENLELIKHNQYATNNKTKLEEKEIIKSIAQQNILDFASNNSAIVDSLLKERVFRKNVNDYIYDDCVLGMDFYFQNDSFYLFNLCMEGRYKQLNDKKDSLSILFVAKNITEYVRYNQFEHFVFVNDSQFYFFNSDYGRHNGPVTIPGFNSKRGFIESINSQDEPFQAYYIFVQKKEEVNKVLFIPDSNLVISNYDKIEKQFVNNYLRNVKPNNLRFNDRILWLSLLLVSIIFNLVLISRRSFSSKK